MQWNVFMDVNGSPNGTIDADEEPLFCNSVCATDILPQDNWFITLEF